MIPLFKSKLFKSKIIKNKTQKINHFEKEIMVRYLTTQPMYRILNSGYKIVPKLLICGNWLEQAGFLPKEHVSITVMGNTLIIRRVENKNEIKPCSCSPINKLKFKSSE